MKFYWCEDDEEKISQNEVEECSIGDNEWVTKPRKITFRQFSQ